MRLCVGRNRVGNKFSRGDWQLRVVLGEESKFFGEMHPPERLPSLYMALHPWTNQKHIMDCVYLKKSSRRRGWRDGKVTKECTTPTEDPSSDFCLNKMGTHWHANVFMGNFTWYHLQMMVDGYKGRKKICFCQELTYRFSKFNWAALHTCTYKIC